MRKTIIALLSVAPVVVACTRQPDATVGTVPVQPTPAAAAEASATPTEPIQVKMETTLGNITLDLYPGDAPNTVANFVRLAQSGYYDGTRFHRVINDFMIQGGDPLSKDVASKDRWGTGGPDEMFADEINSRKLVRGSLAMANRGPDTNGSQFFIVTKEATPWLDGKHTNFGQVVGGMDVVEKIGQVKVDANDRPLNDVIVKKVTVL